MSGCQSFLGQAFFAGIQMRCNLNRPLETKIRILGNCLPSDWRELVGLLPNNLAFTLWIRNKDPRLFFVLRMLQGIFKTIRNTYVFVKLKRAGLTKRPRIARSEGLVSATPLRGGCGRKRPRPNRQHRIGAPPRPRVWNAPALFIIISSIRSWINSFIFSSKRRASLRNNVARNFLLSAPPTRLCLLKGVATSHLFPLICLVDELRLSFPFLLFY